MTDPTVCSLGRVNTAVVSDIRLLPTAAEYQSHEIEPLVEMSLHIILRIFPFYDAVNYTS